jgi:uncharacterized protein YuzE
MRFHYDKKIDALYIRFNEKRYVESDEVEDGIIFDYDKAGKIIGIEVLDASKRFPKEFKSKLHQKRIPVVLDLVKAPA